MVLYKSLLESIQEFAAKDAPENNHGQEEVIAGMDPAPAVERKASGGDYTMDMGMKKQILPPSVQHGKKADLGAKMFGIGGDFEQGFCRGAEQ